MKDFKQLKPDLWNTQRKQINWYWCGIFFLGGIMAALVGVCYIMEITK